MVVAPKSNKSKISSVEELQFEPTQVIPKKPVKFKGAAVSDVKMTDESVEQKTDAVSNAKSKKD